MSIRARALLDEYARDGWSDAFQAGLDAFLDGAGEDVAALIVDGLGRGLKNAYFLREAVSYLPAEAVPAVVERALYAFEDARGRETAEGVLWHVAEQFPRFLHPHLTRLFELGGDAEAYFGGHPWRESGERHHDYLLRVIRGGGKDAHRALRCLLETRTPAAFAALSRSTRLLRYGSETDSLLAVGYERVREDGEPESVAPRSRWAAVRAFFARSPRPEADERAAHPPPDPDEWRRLYPEASYHLRFPDGYRDGFGPPLHPGDRHPTGRLDAGDAPPQRFGGKGACACGVCAGPTQRLIALDPVPAGLGVSLPRLTLEVCLRCVESDWDRVMAYVHDAAGRPSPHRSQTLGDVPDAEPATPLPTQVRLVPTPARWYWQDWGVSNERQNLSRLGGHPSWVQRADYPRCPECHRRMTFLIQLDAGIPGVLASDGTAVCFEGVYYGFWCDRCRVSAYKWQIT